MSRKYYIFFTKTFSAKIRYFFRGLSLDKQEPEFSRFGYTPVRKIFFLKKRKLQAMAYIAHKKG